MITEARYAKGTVHKGLTATAWKNMTQHKVTVISVRDDGDETIATLVMEPLKKERKR